MALGLSVRVVGLERVLAAIDRQSGAALARRVQTGMQAGGAILRTAIRSEAPRRTGVLQRSVSVRSQRSDGSVSVGPRAYYRHWVIRGTSRGIRPNPFVDRGAQRGLNETSDRVADVILRGRR